MVFRSILKSLTWISLTPSVCKLTAGKTFKNFCTMDQTDLLKPPILTNLKKLDRELFKKEVTVPCLVVHGKTLEKLRPVIKPYLLKMPKLKPVIVKEETKLLLNPGKVAAWEDVDEQARNRLADLSVVSTNLQFTTVNLNYDNWNADDILKAVLPPGVEISRSFSKVGHIIHLNLRDHLLEFKQIIGEILLDKIPASKTVVTKLANIDNTYRNFEMEVICGEKDFVTKVKENSHSFEFDFSRVYWNPRLSTEHQRIVDLLQPKDVLFDVFCGVGPFAVPCAKKGCRVYANDLNPECFQWLKHNFLLNKVKKEQFEAFNKDGADFIKFDIKRQLIDLSKDNSFQGKVHITMNLPAIALDFLKYFQNIFTIEEVAEEAIQRVLPTIHVYFFVNGTEPEKTALGDFEEKTNLSRKDLKLSYHYVRNVSPKKDMVRLSFEPPVSYLLGKIEIVEEPAAKRSCHSPR